jgi:hypothetical protein
MHLSESSKDVPVEAKMKVLAMMNAIYNFISGEEFFRSMLALKRNDYISMVKQTLDFILIPAFVSSEGKTGTMMGPTDEDQAGGWLWVNERDH